VNRNNKYRITTGSWQYSHRFSLWPLLSFISCYFQNKIFMAGRQWLTQPQYFSSSSAWARRIWRREVTISMIHMDVVLSVRTQTPEILVLLVLSWTYYEIFNTTFPKFLATMAHYFFLSTFCWLFMISFDLWCTFRWVMASWYSYSRFYSWQDKDCQSWWETRVYSFVDLYQLPVPSKVGSVSFGIPSSVGACLFSLCYCHGFWILFFGKKFYWWFRNVKLVPQILYKTTKG